MANLSYGTNGRPDEIETWDKPVLALKWPYAFSINPWRFSDGPLENGILWIKKRNIEDGELKKYYKDLPINSVVRLRVRPDISHRKDSFDRDALFEAVIQNPAEDIELQKFAKGNKENEPPTKIGKPEFDFWWLLYDILGRFLPKPNISIVRIGSPLPEGHWQTDIESPIFEDCEGYYSKTKNGTVRVGLINDCVQGVLYDLDIYRESGRHRMKKLQTLLKAHSEEEGKIYRIFDNHQGAMMYRTKSDARFAIYAYDSDIFFIHSSKTRYKIK